MKKRLLTRPAKVNLCLCLLLFFACSATSLFAQNANISGKISDDDGAALVGASVVVKGSNNGVITDTNGAFTLSNVPKGSTLVVSFVGYDTKEVAASDNLKIALTEGSALEAVTVTAQKRTEDVQKIPISISVMTRPKITERGINSFDNALRQMPGVEVQGLAQGAQVYIRGIGSSIDPTFADPSVALMVDGVYNGRTETVIGGIFDMERVEVLRGPQGTLYGRNATGGSINIITSNPNLTSRQTLWLTHTSQRASNKAAFRRRFPSKNLTPRI
jgi:outer membrane receptor protein involved in Fe transport